MNFSTIAELRRAIEGIRKRLEPAFGPETALIEPAEDSPPSSGHCAAVATIVQGLFGGQLMSAKVDVQSHWFNRIDLGDGVFDIDITGDQFGLPSVQVARRGHLYDRSRVRKPEELNLDTRKRAALLAARAGLTATAASHGSRKAIHAREASRQSAE
jgi:hypothetical protein